MAYYDPRKPKPWPIRLLNKLGITNDTVATNIALVLALLGILVTIIFYLQLLDDNSSPIEAIDPQTLREMEISATASN